MNNVSVRLLAVTVIALAAGLTSQQGYADPLCIDNATDLFKALKAYSDGGAHSGEDLDINLVLSEYDVGSATGNKPFKYLSTASTGLISLNGGWTTNCAEKLYGSTNTILDGKGIAQVLNIENPNGVYINQLVIQGGETSENGGGLAINTISQKGGEVEVTDSIIQDNHSSTTAGGLAVYASGATHEVDINDNLIVDNSADAEYGAVYEDADSVQINNMVNNTVNGNTTKNGTVGGVSFGGRAGNSVVTFVTSNIFSQNTKTDLYMFGDAGYVAYNDYGSIDGTVPVLSVGNIKSSPKFVNAAGGDYHLSADSPDIGLTVIHGNCDQSYSLDGFIRNYYSDVCDAGAYPETIFASAFEPQ
jgi:hypothetical protein